MTNIPVTFPETYPFALLSQLPRSPSSTQLGNDKNSVYNCGLGETAIVILVMILSAQRKHLMSFYEGIFEIEGRAKLAPLLLRTFKVASSILNGDAFPSNWLNVNILAHKVLIKMFDPVGALMEREFIPTETSTFAFDANLWKEGLSVLLRLLSSEHLAIEEASHQVRSHIETIIFQTYRCFTETSCRMEARWRHPWRRCCYSVADLERPRMASGWFSRWPCTIPYCSK